ncbi:MAG: KTSC domain-containing protein [Solirubrobacteraceae bacterium]
MAEPDMEWVDSSNIEQIGYHEDERELWVRFKSGDTYVYSDVPPATHDDIMRADSKGSYLNREIKPNYDCRRV